MEHFFHILNERINNSRAEAVQTDEEDGGRELWF